MPRCVQASEASADAPKKLGCSNLICYQQAHGSPTRPSRCPGLIPPPPRASSIRYPGSPWRCGQSKPLLAFFHQHMAARILLAQGNLAVAAHNLQRGRPACDCYQKTQNHFARNPKLGAARIDRALDGLQHQARPLLGAARAPKRGCASTIPGWRLSGLCRRTSYHTIWTC